MEVTLRRSPRLSGIGFRARATGIEILNPKTLT